MERDNEGRNIHPAHAKSDGMVTARVIFPVPLEESVSFTVKAVCPSAPSAFPVGSRSHVYGPAPSALTWSILTVTVLPLVTDVTVLLANWSSVLAPMSILPASKVRPHSLTTLAEISASLMILASEPVVWTCRPGLAGEPLVPWAERMTPWL